MVREPMVKRPTFALHGHHRLRSAHAAGDGRAAGCNGAAPGTRLLVWSLPGCSLEIKNGAQENRPDT